MWIAAEAALMPGGRVSRRVAIRVDAQGRIAEIEVGSERPVDRSLEGRLLVPGAINAHSHAFQRALRGLTQRSGTGTSTEGDSFWTWRGQMYALAERLSPASIHVIARQMFLEMALAGTTTVGEFHYVHHRPDGTPYPEPEILAERVIEAARAVGIRIVLLRVIYLRGDFDATPSPQQRRFVDRSLDEALEAVGRLSAFARRTGDPRVSVGVAAHSVRAVPITAIVGAKTRLGNLPFHLHVSEQPLEVERCIEHYGVPPVKLLDDHGVLDAHTCLVHATHLRTGEVQRIASSGATVCFCPTTEADLGDGVGPSEELLDAGVSLSLGTDGQTLSSVWEEARRLEMHERLVEQRRVVLGPDSAVRCFEAATIGGALSLGIEAGAIEVGKLADFAAFDLEAPELAGVPDEGLLAAFLFSSRPLATDVFVGGRQIVADGEHALGDTFVSDYRTLQTQRPEVSNPR